MGAEIIPTTMISTPNTGENVQIADAVKEAWQKRPELQQASLNLENAGTDVKATKNELLPSVNVFGEYIASGLGGVQTATTSTDFWRGGGSGTRPFFRACRCVRRQDLGRVFHGSYSTFEGGINFTLADSQSRGAGGQRAGAAGRAAAKNAIPAAAKRDFRQRAQCADRHAGGSRVAGRRGRGEKAGRANIQGRSRKNTGWARRPVTTSCCDHATSPPPKAPNCATASICWKMN